MKWPKVVKVTRKKYIYYKQSPFQFLNPPCCRSYYFAVKELPSVRKDRSVVSISKQIFPFNSQKRFAFPKMYVFNLFLFLPEFNECSIRNGGCSHGCVDTLGSYFCTCPSGYHLFYETCWGRVS